MGKHNRSSVLAT